MSRYTGPKIKKSRAIGEDLGLKSNPLKVAKRLLVRPGQHGARGRRKLSDFGIQLKEKQKIRYIYGVTEKQLRKLYEKASVSQLATGETMLSLLERRLDNVIYRSGLASTRAQARQLVSHSHVFINDRKMNVPSYTVQVNDVITLTEKGVKIPFVAEALKDETESPSWITKKRAALQIARLPVRSDIQETIEEQLVVEYYSR